MTTFDLQDGIYLAANLSPAQLRQEIRRAGVRAAVAVMYRGTEYARSEDSVDWPGFAAICRDALEAQRLAPRPAPAITGQRFDVEAIKAANDILDIASRYTELRKSGRSFSGRCPIHDDRSPSFHVYPDSQTWHCYGCNKGGDVISFIQAVANTDFRGAAAILGGA